MLEILFGWRKASKCKKLIKYARFRLKILRNKRDVIVRQLRKDVADLLKIGQDKIAFARVEQLFKDQNILEAYDLLDQFCEFIGINLPYIRRHRECPNDINEAISSLIFAAARCADFPELRALRKLFGERYGKDLAVAAVELFPGNHVNQQISEKLCTKHVSDDAKIRLIDEIMGQYKIERVCSDVEDSCNLIQNQQVLGSAAHEKDLSMEKVESENAIQIILSGDEMLQYRQKRPVEYLYLADEKAWCHSISDIESNCIQSSIQKHASEGLQSKNMDINVNEVNKSDPSDQRIFADSSDGDGSVLRRKENHGEYDGSTPLTEHNICRQYLEKSENIAEVAASCEGKYIDGDANFESPSSADLRQYNICPGELELPAETHDRKRRKSVSTYSKNKWMPIRKLRCICANNYEFLDSHRSGRSSREFQQLYNLCLMPAALTMKDIECALYFDKSFGNAGVQVFDPKPKHNHFHKTEPEDFHLNQGTYHRFMMEFADQIFSRSQLSVEERSKGMISGCTKKQPSLKPYKIQNVSRECFFGVPFSVESLGYECRGRTPSNRRRWNQEVIHDCCLEHPCYFFAAENTYNWENSSPNQSFVVTLEGSPSPSIQIQEQKSRPLHQCDANKEYECISTITNPQAGSKQCLDLNSDMGVVYDLKFNRIASNFVSSRNQMTAEGEVRRPSFAHPPYVRALTMPLSDRPKTKQVLRSASFEILQPDHHVHPKLPDYDDLAAKFMALRREHLQNETLKGSNT